MAKPGNKKQLLPVLLAAVLMWGLPWANVQAAKKPVITAPTTSVAELQEVLAIEAQEQPAAASAYEQPLVHPVRERGYLWRYEGTGTGGLPRRFRTEQYPLAKAAWNPSTEGLAALRVSGSANPGRNEFKPLLQTLRTAAGQGPIYIVDLRQESHGYLNNETVSWYGKDNRSNVGLSTAAILQDEAQRLAAAQGKTVAATAFGWGKPTGGKTFTVTSSETEAAAVQAAGRALCQVHPDGYAGASTGSGRCLFEVLQASAERCLAAFSLSGRYGTDYDLHDHGGYPPQRGPGGGGRHRGPAVSPEGREPFGRRQEGQRRLARAGGGRPGPFHQIFL